jgi:RNA polymerase sigma-70 factor (ECF subfamily)
MRYSEDVDADAHLLDTIVQALTGAGRGPDEARTLAPGVLSLYQAGQAAWPGVACPAAAYARHVAGCLQADAGPGGLHGADLYLAAAVLSGDRAAQAEVERLVRAQAQAAAARLDPGPAFAAEVTQEVLERLLLPREDAPPRLADYAGQGPLPAFLRVMAMRTALNLRGSGARTASVDEAALAALGDAADVEARYLRAQYQEAFREALHTAFAGLDRELRQVVRMHYGGGLSGQAIARLLGVDRSTVVRRLASARAALFSETRRLLQERLRLPQAELDSLIAVLRSQIELSLSTILRDSIP